MRYLGRVIGTPQRLIDKPAFLTIGEPVLHVDSERGE
jgi:hypothetical protein